MKKEKINSGEDLSVFLRQNEQICRNSPELEMYSKASIKNKEIEISYREFIKALQDQRECEVVFEDCVFNFLDATQSGTDDIGITKISFIDCKFKYSLVLGSLGVNTRESDFEIAFYKCTFEKDIIISYISPHTDSKNNIKLTFIGNTYHQNTKIQLSNFKCAEDQDNLIRINIRDKSLGHLKLHDISKLLLILPIPIKTLEINNVDSLDFEPVGTLEFEEFILRNSTLNSFPSNKKIKRYEFRNSTIKHQLNITRNFEIESFYVENTIFDKNIALYSSDDNHHKINTVFFKNCTLPKVIFSGCKIETIKFINCAFKESVKLVNFKEGTKEVSFHCSTVHKFLFFNGWEDVLNVSENCTLDFSQVFVEQTGHIIVRNINEKEKKGELDFQYANVLGTVTIQDSKLKSLNMEKSTIVGQFNVEDVDVELANRETARRIKNEFYKNNDTVNALKYRAKEMELYSQELSWRSNFLDFALLKLNSWSNSNGTNWIKGVGFTILSWIFFFGLFVFIKYDDIFFLCMTNYWEPFVKYLWLPQGFGELFSNDASTPLRIVVGTFVFILGKISIAYGIYQTIAAFRKYGK